MNQNHSRMTLSANFDFNMSFSALPSIFSCPKVQVFFYNPSTRTSVWERPPDLYNRPDVDLLVLKPPEEKSKITSFIVYKYAPASGHVMF